MALEDLVTALATASQALATAKATQTTATSAWKAALDGLGLGHPRHERSSGPVGTSTPPDLNALAATVIAAKAAVAEAQTAYAVAKAAVDAEMGNRGVVPSP